VGVGSAAAVFAAVALLSLGPRASPGELVSFVVPPALNSLQGGDAAPGARGFMYPGVTDEDQSPQVAPT